MLRLTIDMSTRHAEIGIFSGAAARATAAWDQPAHPHAHLFTRLPELLLAAGVTAAELGQCVVGVGPGSFSGIRMALAAANGLALPGGIPILGIPSCAAMAHALGADGTAAIVGDARRHRCWVATYPAPVSAAALALPVLVPLASLAEAIPRGARVATCDGDRLGTALAAALPAGATLRTEGVHPTAAALAALAENRLAAGLPLLPPQPLYLHPPVGP